jgi:lysophospholipase L1-like esterase
MKRTLLIFAASTAIAAAADAPGWTEAMKTVHAKFKGKPGAVACYGDSITVTMAFFTPMLYELKDLTPDLATAQETMKKYVQPQCWRDWKEAENGNASGTESQWGADGIGGWLKKQNPEIAFIMWGTNDSKHGPAGPAYKANMAKVVDACLANGTIPVLYTIPPRGDQAGDKKLTELMEGYVKIVRELAAEKKIPLIDFYKEIMDRQPEKFATTLLGDQLHPSFPEGHQNSFSEESLKLSGYTLRNYLTLKMFDEIYKGVLKK